MRRGDLALALILSIFLLASSAECCVEVRAEMIEEKIDKGGPIEYDDMIILGSLNLSGRTLNSVHFNKTVFCGSVNFDDADFIGEAWFSEANFSSDVKLIGANFSDNVYFSKAQFNSNVSFLFSEFYGDAEFDDVIFNGELEFEHAQFNKGVIFKNAKFCFPSFFYDAVFSGTADFQNVQFINVADFTRAHFANGVCFYNAQFSGNTIFVNAQFGGKDEGRCANFDLAKFIGKDDVEGRCANFEGSQFHANVSFNKVMFLCDVGLNKINFTADCSFDKSQFNRTADFSESIFNRNASFKETHFFGDAHFDKSTFNKIANFEDARFPEYAFFEYVTFTDTSKICLNRTRYEKLLLRWNYVEYKDSYSKFKNPFRRSDDVKLVFNGEVYLKLIKNYRDLGWFEDSNQCYFYFMNGRECKGEMQICGPVLKYIYGYGTKPMRPIWLSILVILSCAYIWNRYYRKEIKAATRWDSLRFSIRLFLSGTKLSIEPPKNEPKPTAPFWARTLFEAERVAASILFFFFLFAASASLLIKVT